jgi:hypothetical protein
VSNYMLVAVVLINLLIASLNNTFEEIQVPPHHPPIWA